MMSRVPLLLPKEIPCISRDLPCTGGQVRSAVGDPALRAPSRTTPRDRRSSCPRDFPCPRSCGAALTCPLRRCSKRSVSVGCPPASLQAASGSPAALTQRYVTAVLPDLLAPRSDMPPRAFVATRRRGRGRRRRSPAPARPSVDGPPKRGEVDQRDHRPPVGALASSTLGISPADAPGTGLASARLRSVVARSCPVTQDPPCGRRHSPRGPQQP